MNIHLIDEKAIFTAARAIAEPAERDAYLVKECGDDPKMLGRIRDLLRIADEGDSFLESSAVAITAPWEQPAQLIGTKIGPYKLRELLAEGGMGSVYVAEQEQPVRRKVALKVIKPGMDTREVLSRFEAERQALALMEHPNIAKVLDAGSTDAGRPYFVMELVKGQPIIEFCDQRQLTPRERLKLFTQVCRAIQHAHQKGIIHRDIKPSNILVTLHDDLAVPVVIDFGIAKAAGQQLTEKTLYTAFNQLVGTPLYMSPEQAELNALDVDTRSDIYSLGVLLYELLTGSTPFESETFRRENFDEVRRMIREVDPPRPSQRVSTLSAEDASTVRANRGVDGRQLDRALRGDLDWIVMKSLEKDRNRRYESASSMAADVQRHLDGEPIEARPPGYFAGARKWCRRHSALVGSAMAILIISTLVLIGASLRIAKWYSEAKTSAQNAQKSADESAAVINFLLNDLLGAPQSADRLGTELTLNDVLSNAEAKISKAFTNEPRLEAFIRENLARTFNAIERYEKAERNAQRALDLRLTENFETPAAIRSAAEALIASMLAQGKRDEARKACEAAIAHIEENHGSRDRDAIRLMGVRLKVIFASDYLTKSEVRDSLDLCNEYVQLCSKEFGVNDRTTLEARQLLTFWTSRWGSSDEADAMNHELLEVARKNLGSEDGLTQVLIRNEAMAHREAERYEEVAPLLEEALQAVLVNQGIKNETGIELMLQLASTYGTLGKHEDAGRIIDTLIGASQQTYGPDHGRSIVHLLSLVSDVGFRRDFEHYRRVQDSILAWWDTNHSIRELPDNLSKRYLTCLLAVAGRTDEAKEVTDEMERTIAQADFLEWDQLAWFLATSPIDGVRDGQRAVKIAQKACELSKYQEASPIDTLAAAYAEAGDFDEAERWAEKALEMAQDEPIRAARYTKHLERIKSHKPWREPL